MKLLRPLSLGALLWASASAGGYLLATDGFLREAQPLAAAALALFAGVDVGLALPLTGREPLAARLVAPWALLQLLALLGNPLLGFQVGLSPAAFAAYLFGLAPYDALVALRALQLLVALPLGGGPRRAFAALRPRRSPAPGAAPP